MASSATTAEAEGKADKMSRTYIDGERKFSQACQPYAGLGVILQQRNPSSELAMSRLAILAATFYLALGILLMPAMSRAEDTAAADGLCAQDPVRCEAARERLQAACAKDPVACEERKAKMQQRAEELRKKCEADPAACAERKAKMRERAQRMKEKCDADPAACEKKKAKLRERMQERRNSTAQ